MERERNINNSLSCCEREHMCQANMHMCVFVYVRERQSSAPLSLCVQCSDRCLCVGAGLARHLSFSLLQCSWSNNCVWGWVPNSALASLLASQSLKSRLFIEIENEAKEDASRLLLPLPLLTASKHKFALLLSLL